MGSKKSCARRTCPEDVVEPMAEAVAATSCMGETGAFILDAEANMDAHDGPFGPGTGTSTT